MNFSFFFSSKKSCRVGLAAITVVALTLRSFIPAGYMPDTMRHSDQPFSMTICNGMGPMDMAGMPMPAKKSDGGANFQDRAPCPFSVNAVFASTGVAPVFQVPFIFYEILAGLTVFAFVRMRRFGNVAPRAPPLVS